MSTRKRHKSWWYSRSEDLSELIFVCDIRDAIVRPPISQGKAPKWHGSIHLKKQDKRLWGSTKRNLLGDGHKTEGISEQRVKEKKRYWWNSMKVCGGSNKIHQGSATIESFENIDYTGRTQLSQLFKECVLSCDWDPGCFPGPSTDTKLPTKLLSTKVCRFCSSQISLEITFWHHIEPRMY